MTNQSFIYCKTIFRPKGGVAIRPLFGPLCFEKIQVLNFKYLYTIFEYSICLLFKYVIDIKWFWILLLRGIYEDRYPNWFLSIFPIFGRFSVIFHQIFQIWTLKTLEYPKNFTYMLKLYKRAFHKANVNGISCVRPNRISFSKLI